MKRLLLSFFTIFFIFATHFSYAESPKNLNAQWWNVWTGLEASKIYFSVFSRADCVHCIQLKKFLDAYFGSWEILPRYYNIDEITNKLLYIHFVETNHLSKVTPIILIGNTLIQWFDDEETTGKTILEATKKLSKSSFFEDKSIQISDKTIWKACTDGILCDDADVGIYVKIPLIWVRDLRQYSLLFLSVILWFIDGFNPCAMWVLVMFLSILSQSGSRKKMIQIAGTFIIAEAVMYFAILNAWYKTWDFVKLDGIVTPVIGLVSVGAGIFFLYEFFTNKDGECKITSTEQKKKTVKRIKYIVENPMTLWIFLATIGIAFSVNIIEFACSIGIPQAFTKLLEMSSLGFFAKQIYVLIYTFSYMIDDFVVFWIAIYAFQYLHLTTKYTRYCLVLGGIIMILLGYLFLFNPVFLKEIIA